MAILRCKMCGGDLHIQEGTICECEYCGTQQTIPRQDDEKKLNLIARAERLRRSGEFDKAAGIYESLIPDYPEESEIYWGLVLCKYGIEYVTDPNTGKMIPTCHRLSFTNVLEDSDYEMAAEYADPSSRRILWEQAKEIERIRSAIIEISAKESPYDIFISYKETDESGERTIDSVLAQDIYKELTKKEYRVFFSRISLENKIGQDYEPIIFSALNSAKIMLVIGTCFENFDAVWVKNEWSRYLKMIAAGEKKTLIPCFRDVDPYDIPKEFSRLQAQDLGKIGAIQDLIRGIDKLMGKDQPKPAAAPAARSLVKQEENLVRRGNMALEDGDYQRACEFFDKALNINPEYSDAYLGLEMATKQTSDWADFERLCLEDEQFPSSNLERALKYSDHKPESRIVHIFDSWEAMLSQRKREQEEAEAEAIRKQEEKEQAERARIQAEQAAKVAFEQRSALRVRAAQFWKERILLYYNRVYAVRPDGTVVCSDPQVYVGGLHNVDTLFYWKDGIFNGPPGAVLRDGTVSGMLQPERVKGGFLKKSRYDYDLSGWTNLKKVLANNVWAYGLRKDGSLLFSGKTHTNINPFGKLADFGDIGEKYPEFFYKLLADGTAIDHLNHQLKRWRKCIQICMVGNALAGLDENGRIQVQLPDTNNSVIGKDHQKYSRIQGRASALKGVSMIQGDASGLVALDVNGELHIITEEESKILFNASSMGLPDAVCCIYDHKDFCVLLEDGRIWCSERAYGQNQGIRPVGIVPGIKLFDRLEESFW